MIIRCHDGRLLESQHVVHWENRAPQPNQKQHHTVVATTVLDTEIDVFHGTEAECEDCLAMHENLLSEEPRMLRRLCKELVKRDDKLSASMRRMVQMAK